MKSIYDKLDDLDIVPNLYLRLIKSTARSRKRYDPSRIFSIICIILLLTIRKSILEMLTIMTSLSTKF